VMLNERQDYFGQTVNIASPGSSGLHWSAPLQPDRRRAYD
jgi:hypothetical protein